MALEIGQPEGFQLIDSQGHFLQLVERYPPRLEVGSLGIATGAPGMEGPSHAAILAYAHNKCKPSPAGSGRGGSGYPPPGPRRLGLI